MKVTDEEMKANQVPPRPRPAASHRPTMVPGRGP